MSKRVSRQLCNSTHIANYRRQIGTYNAKQMAQEWARVNPNATQEQFLGYACGQLRLNTKTGLFLWALLFTAHITQGGCPQVGTSPSTNAHSYQPSFDLNYTESGTHAVASPIPSWSNTSNSVSCVLPPAPSLSNTATLGSEFTFFRKGLGNREHDLPGNIVRNPATEEAQEALASNILENCPPCTVREEINKYGAKSYNITHPDGFWINVDTDPSVVETQMKPMTLAEYEKHGPTIQRLLFDGAKSLELKPDSESDGRHSIPFRMGGGHIHFGLHSTFDDSHHLMNFEIDQQNNPYLATGALGNYPRNAAPLAVQSDSQRESFNEIIKVLSKSKQDLSLEELSSVLNKAVFYRSLDPKSSPGPKYQQASVAHATKDTPAHARTVEFRAPGPQRDVNHFVQLARLLLKRIEMLKSLEGFIRYEEPTIEKCDWDESSGCLFGFSNAREQKVVDSFYRFVVEMGESWDEHQNLLEPVLRDKIDKGQLLAPQRPSNPEMQKPSAFAEAIMQA